MEEITREATTLREDNPNTGIPTPSGGGATNYLTGERLAYFLFGALEILLVFRFVLKLAGASPANAFMGLIYGLSGIFVSPFAGIFHRGYAQGVETTSVFEPSTLIAILVYAVVAWGIVKLVRILSGEKRVS
jgi:hypothetical protein